MAGIEHGNSTNEDEAARYECVYNRKKKTKRLTVGKKIGEKFNLSCAC